MMGMTGSGLVSFGFIQLHGCCGYRVHGCGCEQL